MAIKDPSHAPKQVVFRGTTRYWLSPLSIFLGASFIGVAWNFFGTGWLDVLKALGWAVAAPIVIWMGIGTMFAGIRADRDGVKITNIWYRYYIPWSELRDIAIHQESDEGVGVWVLQFHRAGEYPPPTSGALRKVAHSLGDGSVVTAWLPRSHSGGGEGSRLDRVRVALLALRDEALRGPSA